MTSGASHDLFQMLKLLICIVAAFATAMTTLQLRQQRLNLQYQTNRLHNQIQSRQAELWNQQLQIAIYTAPNAIQQTVGDHALKMVPRSPLPAQSGHWLDPQHDPDAE